MKSLINVYADFIHRELFMARKPVELRFVNRYLMKKISITSLSFLTVTILSMHFLLKITSLPTIALASLTSALLPFILYPVYLIMESRSYHRELEEEFKYFLISNYVSLSKDSDLLKDLQNLSAWCNVFKKLCRESNILRRLVDFLGIVKGVNEYRKWVKSKIVNSVLTDYLLATNSGTYVFWMQGLGQRILDEVRTNTYNVIKARATVSLVVAVLLGYTPVVVVPLTTLLGSNFINQVFTLTIVLAPISFFALPKYPKHLKFEKTTSRKNLTLLPLLTIPTITYYLLFKKFNLLVLSLPLLMFGIYVTKDFLKNVRELSRLSKFLDLASGVSSISINPLDSLKKAVEASELDFEFSPLELTLRKQKPVSRSWVASFVFYCLSKGLSLGVISREVLSKLQEVVNEALRSFRAVALANSVIVALALLLPLLQSATINIIHQVNTVITTYIIITSIFYSCYASYVVFEDLTNTFLPSITMLELNLLGVI